MFLNTILVGHGDSMRANGLCFLFYRSPTMRPDTELRTER